MIYCKTNQVEQIAVHPLNDTRNTQFIELVKYGDMPIFSVWVDDGEDEWIWEFEMNSLSDYERVKLSIFDAIFECDTMLELAEAFNSIFEHDFADILIVDNCDECNGCDGCKFAR